MDGRIKDTGCWKIALWGAAVVLATLLPLFSLQPRAIRFLEHWLYDAIQPRYGHDFFAPSPVIVDMDEATLSRFGPLPWPRYLLAELVDKLAMAGVTAIGIELPLSDPDRSSLPYLSQTLLEHKGVVLTYSGLPVALADFDNYLAQALREKPTVLPVKKTSAGASQELPEAGISFEVRGEKSPFRLPLLDSVNLAPPLPLFHAAAPLGIAIHEPDPDGTVRRAPLIWRKGEDIYPCFALRVLMRSMDQDSVTAHVGSEGLFALQVGHIVVPVTREGRMLIPYKGDGGTHARVSAGAILADEAPEEMLRSRMVLVGGSESYAAEQYATPWTAASSGVEIHAAILEALAAGFAIQVPPWAERFQVWGIILTTLVSVLLFSFARVPIAMLVSLALAGAAVLGSSRLMEQAFYISPLFFLLSLIAPALVILPLRSGREHGQKRRLNLAFARYIPPEVVRRITASDGRLRLGEERDITILFTDIRGFTSLSEHLPPPLVVSLLNRCFTPMAAIVRDRKGTLDKFMGDAMLAFWNAPLDVDKHPVLAVDAGLAMNQRLTMLNRELSAEYGYSVSMGIGIHTGSAYVGNLGSDEFLNYTLIGDNVNLASRIEGLCPLYGVPILASEETMLGCGGAFAVQYVDTLRVKGRDTAVSIFIPMRHETYQQRRNELETWKTGCSFYKKGKFEDATDIFAILHLEHPDCALYRVYLDRAGLLMVDPPEEWDGIWTMDEKNFS